MNTVNVTISQASRIRTVDRGSEPPSERRSPTALSTAPSEWQSQSLTYKLKNENSHCWAICKLRKRRHGNTYQAWQWFTTLEQACDRLAELYLHEAVGWEVVNLADVRKAIAELKSSLTNEMLDRMMIH